jgi:hypothetical protein
VSPTRKPRRQPGEDDKPREYCGCCFGHRSIWCPPCYGFFGCDTCQGTFRVPCPECAGGTLEPITSYRGYATDGQSTAILPR